MYGKRLTALLCAVVLLIGCMPLTALAQKANVTYKGKARDLIFQPGSNDSPTDLFPNFKDVMPGDTLTQTITVRNKADSANKVKIYLRSLGSTNKKYDRFLNQLTLTVKAKSKTPLFRAAADKAAGLTNWVCLGTLYAGGALDLDVTLHVPVTLTDRFQKQIGKIKWQFVVREYPIEKPTWKCKKNHKHTWHIEQKDGVARFVCDDCGRTAPVKCKVCGGTMHEVLVIEVRGHTYTVYQHGDTREYRTKDGKARFFFSERGILKYFTAGGKRTNIRNISEYRLYSYYECNNKKKHHTDPQPVPQTGNEEPVWLWITLASVSVVLLILLLLCGKRRKRSKEETP